MWLKRATALMLLGCLVLLAAWPWVVGPKMPVNDAEALAVSRRLLLYVGTLALLLVGSGIGATMIVRQARQEYRRQSRENMQKLVDGIREDSEKAHD